MVAATVVLLGALSLLGLLIYWFSNLRRRKFIPKIGATLTNSAKFTSSNLMSLSCRRDMLLKTHGIEGAQLLTLKELEVATDNFMDKNKLGT